MPVKLKLDVAKGTLSLATRKDQKIEFTSALTLLLVLSSKLEEEGHGFINYRWFDEIGRLKGLQVVSSSYS